MKKLNQNNTTTTTVSFEDLREKFLDTYELTEKFIDELDSIPENDLDGLQAFIERYEKLEKIQIPEKLKAVKLSDLNFDAVSVGGVFKFHYTDKAIKAMAKNNIKYAIAYSDDEMDIPSNMEYDTAIVTAIDGENITAISKDNGGEYCLIPDDFDGIIDGKQYATCKNCLFGILPFTYKAPATATA